MQNQLSRRQALKTIIAASGGVAAASFLPAEWMRPLVLSGVLPVHAQYSLASCLFGLEFFTIREDDNYYSVIYHFISPPDPRPTVVSFLETDITINHVTPIFDSAAYHLVNLEEDMWTRSGRLFSYELNGGSHPSTVTCKLNFYFGEYDDDLVPIDLSNACEITCSNYSIEMFEP